MRSDDLDGPRVGQRNMSWASHGKLSTQTKLVPYDISAINVVSEGIACLRPERDLSK